MAWPGSKALYLPDVYVPPPPPSCGQWPAGFFTDWFRIYVQVGTTMTQAHLTLWTIPCLQPLWPVFQLLRISFGRNQCLSRTLHSSYWAWVSWAQFSTSTEGLTSPVFHGEKPWGSERLCLVDLEWYQPHFKVEQWACTLLAVFAGKQLKVERDSCLSALLTGDGSCLPLVFLPDLTNEYVVIWCLSVHSCPRRVAFIIKPEQNGVAPAEVSWKMQLRCLLRLLLAKAKKVLMDYLGEQRLPEDSKFAILCLTKQPSTCTMFQLRKYLHIWLWSHRQYYCNSFRACFETVHPLT